MAKLAERSQILEIDTRAIRAAHRTCSLERNTDPRGCSVESRNVLAFIPQAADGEDEVRLRDLPSPFRAAPVVHEQDRRTDVIDARSLRRERDTRGDHSGGTVESALDELAQPRELVRQRCTFDGAPPARDAAVLEGDARLFELRLGEQGGAARLDDVDALAHGNLCQRIAGAPKLGCIRLEPVERKPCIDQLEPARFLALGGTRRRTHHGEHSLDADRLEPTRKFETINPHPANRIGDEQQPQWRGHSAALARWRAGRSSSPRSFASHSARRATPSRQLRGLGSPRADCAACVSDTYQRWSPLRQSSNLSSTSDPVAARISSSSCNRLIALGGPPPRLKARPCTRSIFASAAT